ncbi:MAG: phospho-sugar mutase [Brevinema sp.]
MNKEILEKAKEWTSIEYDPETRAEIQILLDQNNEEELTDRFWRELEFGTGGLRGIRGAGTNRMNIYNIKKVTQGLANYLKNTGNKNKGVVIGRDSRIFSLEFAKAAAAVLVANQIPVYFFKDLCPTPILSFAIRTIGAQAGIMNTASHNPKEYNGYKVFWDNGGQVIPPHDTNMIHEVDHIQSLTEVKDLPFEEVEQSSLFRYCDEILDEYINKIKNISRHPEICKETDLRILYSPLHGCGYKVTRTLAKAFGFKNFEMFSEQSTPDGNFPSAPYPNPEDPNTMNIGLDYAKKQGADLFVATDPDADRLGVGYKTSKGDYKLLNGNQIGALFTYYLLNHDVPKNSVLITTIVTTPLIKKIADNHQIEYQEVLTGFKWIAHIQQELHDQNKHFVFGFEESHGYNSSNMVYDKDGVSSAVLFAELVAYYKKQGKYLDEILLEISKKYGYYKESQVSLTLPGASGVTKINQMMENFRTQPPKKIGTHNVLKTIDYLNDQTGLPKSNVFAMFLSENIRIIARPSGTEPKIKFYFSSHDSIGCEACIENIDHIHEQIKNEFLAYIS